MKKAEKIALKIAEFEKLPKQIEIQCLTCGAKFISETEIHEGLDGKVIYRPKNNTCSNLCSKTIIDQLVKHIPVVFNKPALVYFKSVTKEVQF